MSARTPRPTRRPVKTEDVTESRLNYLQKEVDKYNLEIASIRKRIDNHLQQQKDYENLKYEDEEKLKKVEFIKGILNKYRKEIGMPDLSQQAISSSKSTPTSKKISSSPPRRNSILNSYLAENKNPNSLKDFTIYRFDRKREDIDELTKNISELQDLLNSLQSQAAKTKVIIQNLNLQIPDLKNDLSKLNLEKIYNQALFDKKLYKAIYSIDFYQDEINKRKQTIKQLKNDIQDLQPQSPSLKLVKHPIKDSRFSISPSNDMAKCRSFEQNRIKKGIKFLTPILKYAKVNRINDISAESKEIKSKLNASYNKLNQTARKAQVKLASFKLLEPQSNTSQLIEEKAKKIALLKETIKKNNDQLKEIQTDIPKIRSLSPEGLLKWRSTLLNQIKVESSKYDDDIKKAEVNLKNTKFISDRRIKALQKSIDEKNGK